MFWYARLSVYFASPSSRLGILGSVFSELRKRTEVTSGVEKSKQESSSCSPTKLCNWNKFSHFWFNQLSREKCSSDMFRNAVVIIFVVSLGLNCYSMQTSRVPAKAEGCVEEVCGTLCEYEGHKFFPGSNSTLYREFTCLEMTCSNDFHVQFEP